MIVEAVQHEAGTGHLRIIGRLGYTLHETSVIPWDTKHPTAKAELEFAVANTGADRGDLYDVIRQEQYRARRSSRSTAIESREPPHGGASQPPKEDQ